MESAWDYGTSSALHIRWFRPIRSRMDVPPSTDRPAGVTVNDPLPPAEADAALHAELRKREVKRQADARRPLDSWERYRALNDAMDEAFERIDMNNRETRFALIFMGALNAATALTATRKELIVALSPGRRMAAGVLLAIYAACAGYFLLQAINGLQPRHFRPRLGDWAPDGDDYPMGIRYFEDVVARDAQGYWKAWQDVRMSQINAEIAIQVHSLCLKANVKQFGLRRLFSGLRVMAVLVGCLLALVASAAWK